MATLILSVAGQVIGGPVGSMIGAMAGQYIDQNILFKPKAQHGPRLNELAVQTSSYGVQVPRIYGRMRVAGQVIWALPLKETRHKQSAKGRPDQISYTYSASFAVALSSRALAAVKRIWADGTLIRKANGAWEKDAVMRFHTGDADQPLDPLIASAEGMEAASAHRGLAYVVFEDLPLADYGNRIPSLTFEVEADDGIDAGAVAADMLPGWDMPDAALAVEGYAASGDNVRAAIGPLSDAVGWSLGPRGLSLGGSVASLDESAIQAAKDIPAIETRRGGADAIPSVINVRHYDPARDYQIGMQRARVAGASGQREAANDMPVVLASAAAKALAEKLAARAGDEPQRLTVPVGPQALAYVPGMLLAVPGVQGVWRVARWGWEGESGRIELVRYAEGDGVMREADPGRGQPSPEGPSGALYMALVDLPGWQAAGASAEPLVGVFVASAIGRGGALVTMTASEGGDPVSLGRVLDADAFGYADTALADGSAAMLDDANVVDVTLVNPAMTLSHASDAVLLGGANAAMLGSELIQFGRAEALGEAVGGGMRYRLSHLLRGRSGTEAKMAAHEAGEVFVLLPDDVRTISLLPAHIGLQPLTEGMIVEARRAGSAHYVAAELLSASAALRPLAPVHVRAEPMLDGGVMVRWVRRSRAGWAWADYMDAPLGEAEERYRVQLRPSAGASMERYASAPEITIPAADVAAWRSAGANQVRIVVAQMGTHGVSEETDLFIPLS